MDPAVPGNLCHNSSVTKGAKGWSRTMVSRKTRHKTFLVADRFDPAASSSYSLGLMASRYQSQNSCHTNRYSALAASLKRYLPSASETSSETRITRERIHLSGSERASPFIAIGSVCISSDVRCIRANRAAFQSLFMKCRYPSTRFSDIFISRPCAAKAARVNRNASVPWDSIIVRGSTALPVDLLIFCPSSSLTRAWIYTSLNGISPMKWIPIIIIRATQKNKISKAVTSTEVG